MKQLLLVCLLSVAFAAPAQNPAQPPAFICASEEIMATRPMQLEEQQRLETFILERKKATAAQKSAANPLVLPVVVHIVHQNGSENIPDNQVIAAIEHLNQAFAHEAYYAAQGDGVDTKIQFCLAQRTPDGQATNGITRTVSPFTEMVMETNDQSVKNLIRWNPRDYVNIWVVKSITSLSIGPGVAGYAYLASAHGQPHDGIVCEAVYFGADAASDAVLIHEAGHYLNLYHTFQGSCPNDDCRNQGDRVCDTPPDQATHSSCNFNSCSTDTDDDSPNNPIQSDISDLTENFMDYSPFHCYRSFTAGQGARMQFAIENFRNSLLESNGCKSPCTDVITVAFLPSGTNIVAGETVSFANQSIGATDFIWKINGSTASVTTDLSWVFNSPGYYEVALIASNQDPNCETKATAYISVNCNVQAAFTANNTNLEIGQAFVCTNNSSGAASYIWTINGVEVSTQTDLNYQFSNDGNYTVSLQANGPFCNNQAFLNIQVLTGNGCQDSVTGFYYHMTNTVGMDYLNFDAVLPNGDRYLNGYFPWEAGLVMKMDQHDNLLWRKKIEIPVNGLNLSATQDGGVIGRYIWNQASSHRFFKMDKDGQFKWVKKIDNEFTAFPFGYKNGALIVSGSNSSDQFRTVAFDGEGSVLWNKKYALDAGCYVFDHCMTADSTGIWVVGYASYKKGAMAMRLDTLGNIVYMRRYDDGEGNAFEFRAIRSTPDGGFIAAGRRIISEPLDNDFLIIKADQNGQPEWIKMIGMDDAGQVWEGTSWIELNPQGGYVVSYVDYTSGRFSWGGFSETGELQYMKTAKDEKGNVFRFSLLKSGPNLYAAGNITTDPPNNFFAAFDPERGPLVGCFEVTDVPVTTFDHALQTQDFVYVLLPDTILIQSSGLQELPADHDITRIPFCSETIYCPELCDNGLDDDDDGLVDCYDSDCHCFDGVDCVAAQPVYNLQGKLDWKTPGNPVNNVGKPMVANLDPQNGNVPEIIIAGAAIPGTNTNRLLIYKGNGENASAPNVLWVPGSMNNSSASMVLGDINADKTPELIQVNYDDLTMHVFTNYQDGATTPMSLWTTSVEPVKRTGSNPGLADFDSDGNPEVYVDNAVFRFDWTNPGSPTLRKVLEGNGHFGLSLFAYSQSVAADLLSPADCGGDPDCAGLELAAGAYIYSIDLDPLDGDGLEIKTQRNLNALQTEFTYADGHTFVADINLDGVLDVLVVAGNNAQRGVYTWNKNGLIQFFPFPNQNPANNSLFSALAIANVYDDTQHGFSQDFPEIIVPRRNGRLICLNVNAATLQPATPWWWDQAIEDGSSLATPTCFDFNADGWQEIVFRDERNLRIMYGGPAPFPPGVDNNRNWYTLPCESITGVESPIIADVDADGAAEIVVTGVDPATPASNGLHGTLFVVEGADLPWAPARNLWNQNNYFGVHINDDLSVPKQQQALQLEFPGLGSGKRPFNAAMCQLPATNEHFDPYLPVPDARIQIDSFRCEGDSIRVWAQICNNGSRPLPANLPVTFYQNDPRQAGAIGWGTTHIDSSLPEGNCISFSGKIAAIFNTPVFVVVGDDGSQVLPYSLNDFPISSQAECHYENNFASFSFPLQPLSLNLGPDFSLCGSSVRELQAGAGFSQYRWHDGSVDSTFTAYGPGVYWVETWDACGNRLSDTLTITPDIGAVLELGDDLVICDSSSRQIIVEGFESVQWYPTTGLSCSDCPNPVVAPTSTVTYYVVGSNGNCFSSDSVTVVVNSAPSVSISVQNGTCGVSAELTAIVDGSTSDVLWSSGETGMMIQPVLSGLYSVTATNSAGCTAVATDSVQVLSDLSMDFQITPISCTGGAGGIRVTGFGGSGEYTFEWSNGASSPFIEVLLPGTYEVTMTDTTGLCAITGFVVMEIAGELELMSASTPVSCAGNQDGSLAVFPIDGTPPFSWLWQNGQTDSLLTGLASGAYAVTVTDVVGCSQVFETILSEPAPLQVQAEAADSLLCADETTTLIASAAGGSPPYSFLWNTGQTSAQLTGITAGQWMVAVTDARSCTTSTAVEILLQPSFVVTLDTLLPASGPATADGAILLQLTGGSGPFAYAWSNGTSSLSLFSIPPGVYDLTVTDGAACTQVYTFSVTFTTGTSLAEPPGWTAYLSPNPTSQRNAAQLVIQTAVAQNLEVQLFDARGALLDQQRLDLPDGWLSVPITAPAAAGVYFVVLRSGQELRCLRWVVE